MSPVARKLAGGAVAILAAAAWLLLRTGLEARLVATAQRDLDTIVELVSLELTRGAAATPGVRGAALLHGAAAAERELARILARAEDEHKRRIYFFDRAGVVTLDGGAGAASPAPPGIVRHALATGLAAAADRHGTLFEPYPDDEGEQMVGVWLWLGERELGIVAERPYARFIQPLRWVDGAFGVAALLGALVFIFVNQISPGRLRAAFRRSDLDACGPYAIKRLIGEGAMANVYLAEHRHLKRAVALKRLKIHAQSDELLERFDREARLASQLAHPNIITVLDHGAVPGGGFYYTMEFIHGLTLSEWVEQHGPLPPARVVRILRQICAAVGAMHARDLLHRDIKPANVIAYAAHGDYDLIKLLDFGLIKDLASEASRDLTRDVRVLGTPAFMAPERLRDPRFVDPRTDLYGIGCIGFFLLTGRKPFEATRDADLVQQIQHVEAPRAAAASIFPLPAALDRLIADALAKDMARRPASAAAFDAALYEIERLVPWQHEQARLWWLSVFPCAAEPSANADD